MSFLFPLANGRDRCVRDAAGEGISRMVCVFINEDCLPIVRANLLDVYPGNQPAPR